MKAILYGIGLLLALPAFPAVADEPIVVAQAVRLSLADAIAAVQRQSGGKVLSAQDAPRGGRPGYRIKVLTPRGEVVVFYVDAATGAVEAGR